MSGRAVFFDRDGTLIENVGYCADPGLVRVTPGTTGALRELKRAGFRAIIVTNQSGIARGLIGEHEYAAVHARVLQLLGPGTIDATYVCPDAPDGGSLRRKPLPAMVLEAASEHGLDLGRSFFVGDQPTDVECGQRAGTRTVLLGNAAAEGCRPDFVARDVAEAVRWILER
jgi:D-glycero-D-manno-heptose 1,7-bisphosphate phosphatase